MDAAPRNLLVMHFGQLGDVVLGLPAMKAIRDRFPDARLTAVVGAATAEIVTISGLFDEVLPVDRVRLLRSNKIKASIELIRFALSIRRRRFDLVIDLHSLPETNILGFVSGAKLRLFSKREGRSLNFLSNFRPPAPTEDNAVHLSQGYLNVLAPTGVSATVEPFVFAQSTGGDRFIDPVVGLDPGAGHPSRRWPVENFAELARMIVDRGIARVSILIGPEDLILQNAFSGVTNDKCVIDRGSSLRDLVGSLSRLSLLVSNDTGPTHLAAATDTPIILLLHATAPDRFLPFSPNVVIHRGTRIEDIQVTDVYDSVISLLEGQMRNAFLHR